jgi:hypothetical protein
VGGLPATKEHRRLNTYDGITPDVFTIERLAGAYVEHKYLELIPIHIIVQLAWFCHAFDMELGRRDKWGARPTNAEWPFRG